MNPLALITGDIPDSRHRYPYRVGRETTPDMNFVLVKQREPRPLWSLRYVHKLSLKECRAEGVPEAQGLALSPYQASLASLYPG